jgi:quinol monooxygenase YgiN
VFQETDDIGALLYVGEWTDRAAFEQYRAEAAAGAVEASIRDAGEFLICERLLFFGNYAHRARVTGCAILEAPSDTDDIVRDLLLPNGRWFGHGLPGLVHYSVYREMTHHHRYVIVHGWQSETALLALRERPRLEHEALQKVGGSVIRFTGYERASTDLL